jgi:uncharacterized protein YlxW (UPF0749 family)
MGQGFKVKKEEIMFDNKGKTVIFFIVLISISLILAGGTFYLLQQEKSNNLKLTEQLKDMTTKYEATRMDLEKSTKKISGLEFTVEDYKTQISSLSSDLEREKSAKQEALGRVKKLQDDLDLQIATKSDLEKKLVNSDKMVKDMETRLMEMEAQLRDLGSKKVALEDKVKGLEQKTSNVELGKIVVSPEPSVSAATGAPAAFSSAQASPVKLEGKVLVVNKDYNFAVISLGAKDGVALGSKFGVLHNNKKIGDLQIEKIHDSMSAAGFMSPEIKEKIAEGDKVEFKS